MPQHAADLRSLGNIPQFLQHTPWTRKAETKRIMEVLPMSVETLCRATALMRARVQTLALAAKAERDVASLTARLGVCSASERHNLVLRRTAAREAVRGSASPTALRAQRDSSFSALQQCLLQAEKALSRAVMFRNELVSNRDKLFKALQLELNNFLAIARDLAQETVILSVDLTTQEEQDALLQDIVDATTVELEVVMAVPPKAHQLPNGVSHMTQQWAAIRRWKLAAACAWLVDGPSQRRKFSVAHEATQAARQALLLHQPPTSASSKLEELLLHEAPTSASCKVEEPEVEVGQKQKGACRVPSPTVRRVRQRAKKRSREEELQDVLATRPAFDVTALNAETLQLLRGQETKLLHGPPGSRLGHFYSSYLWSCDRCRGCFKAFSAAHHHGESRARPSPLRQLRQQACWDVGMRPHASPSRSNKTQSNAGLEIVFPLAGGSTPCAVGVRMRAMLERAAARPTKRPRVRK